LRDDGNARLVYNLVAAAGISPASTDESGGQILFDEFHHGYQTARSVTTWLQSTAPGQSLLYTGVVIFVYLLVGGRRFGRPLPMPDSTTRRAPVEHVQAMANLFRRAGKRARISRHYHDRLKRELARPYHLDPALDDAHFVDQLAMFRPDLDRAALSRLLHKAGQALVSEGELIRLVQEVDEWTRPTA
jgi:hypothetical protein